MARLDLDTISRYVDHANARLAEHGLTFRVSLDMGEFKEFLIQQPKTHGVPPTHDPDKCVLTEANAFWAYLETAEGWKVSCIAQRLFCADDFIETCRAQTAFMDRVPGIDLTPIDLTPEASYLDISGRVNIGGGIWIHPNWRGRDLLVYTRLARAIALRHWRWNWIAGFMYDTPNRKAMSLDFGYPRAVSFVDGHYPPHGPKPGKYQLVFGDRNEFMQQLRAELEPADSVASYA